MIKSGRGGIYRFCVKVVLIRLVALRKWKFDWACCSQKGCVGFVGPTGPSMGPVGAAHDDLRLSPMFVVDFEIPCVVVWVI